jgi:hypothetical protein
LREIWLYIEGQTNIRERTERESWERVRWAAAALLQPHLSKGKKLKLTDLAVFPWEVAEATPAKGITEATREKWAQWDEDMKRSYGK